MTIPNEPLVGLVRRLERFTRQQVVPPQRLTLATAVTICDFLGISDASWRWMLSTESNSPLGPPPPPREPGGLKRGRGVADIWILELDILPWLFSTDAGRDLLAKVLDEIRAER